MGLCLSADRHRLRYFRLTGVEATAATIAKWLFGIFLVLFIAALAIGLTIGAKLFS